MPIYTHLFISRHIELFWSHTDHHLQKKMYISSAWKRPILRESIISAYLKLSTRYLLDSKAHGVQKSTNPRL